MDKKYYATYFGTKTVCVFGAAKERDDFVSEEKVIHPECSKVSARKIECLIKGRKPVYDESFGCMIVEW